MGFFQASSEVPVSGKSILPETGSSSLDCAAPFGGEQVVKFRPATFFLERVAKMARDEQQVLRRGQTRAAPQDDAIFETRSTHQRNA